MSSHRPLRTLIGVDLTSSGAPEALQRERDPQMQAFVLARLAGLAKLLDGAGVDFLGVGQSFRVGGKPKPESYLDGAHALARAGSHTKRIALAPAIPLARIGSAGLTAALTALNAASGNRAGWQLEAPTPKPAKVVRAAVGALKGRARAAETIVNVRTEVDVEIAAATATIARLQAQTVEEARNLRSTIRQAAQDWGREPSEIAVLIDAQVILADDAQAAENRALLIDDLTAEHTHTLRHVGTVQSFATVWQNWVRAGAADGFTLIPQSIPTDVLQIATRLVPELNLRGLRSGHVAATPVRTREKVLA